MRIPRIFRKRETATSQTDFAGGLSAGEPRPEIWLTRDLELQCKDKIYDIQVYCVVAGIFSAVSGGVFLAAKHTSDPLAATQISWIGLIFVAAAALMVMASNLPRRNLLGFVMNERLARVAAEDLLIQATTQIELLKLDNYNLYHLAARGMDGGAGGSEEASPSNVYTLNGNPWRQ